MAIQNQNRPSATPFIKKYLMTPGPTPIPERVQTSFSQPILHHRTPAFQRILEEVQSGLRYLFQTEQPVLVLTGSGTSAMEAAVCNLFRTEDTVITINGGKFGARWTSLAKTYGLNPVEITLPLGDTLDPAVLRVTFQKNPGAKAVLFQASETATGSLMPTREICAIARQAGALSICDAITACGVFELPMDAWGIDVLITGSQKALMLPPGIALISLSPAAWKAVESCNLPRYYLDLKRERDAQAKAQSAWTPAITLIQALNESLQMIREEGLEALYARHDLLARATRAGVAALGLELVSKTAPSTALTAVRLPPEIPDGRVLTKLMREKFGVQVGGGQDALEGKIIRLSHFGYFGAFDVTTTFSALELAFNELGYSVEFGKSVGAVLEIFAKNWGKS